MSTSNKRRVGVLIVGIVTLCIALIVIVFIPFVIDRTFEREVQVRFEQKQRARLVVTEWEADRWATSEEGTIEFDVYANKLRGECWFITDSQGSVGTRAALAMVNGRPTKIDVEFLKDAMPGASRASGAQFFNRWRLTPPPGERIDPGEIRLETAHFCPDGGVGPNGEETGTFEFQSAGPFYYPGIPGDAPSGLPKIRVTKPLE